MVKEYRLRLKHKDLVTITRCLGNHLLRELPNGEWDDELAHIYDMFEWFTNALRGRRGRKSDGVSSYPWWLKEHKDLVLKHIRDGLAEVKA